MLRLGFWQRLRSLNSGFARATEHSILRCNKNGSHAEHLATLTNINFQCVVLKAGHVSCMPGELWAKITTEWKLHNLKHRRTDLRWWDEIDLLLKDSAKERTIEKKETVGPYRLVIITIVYICQKGKWSRNCNHLEWGTNHI